MNESEYKITNYGGGAVYLGEGWHSIDELREIIKQSDKNNEQLRRDMERVMGENDE